MSMSLGRTVANSAIALSLVFGLAACESSADFQRKPELVDLMANQSVATCVLQKSDLDQKPYDLRIRDVLNDTRANALDYFIANKITVCLDKRLQEQHNGFFGTNADGVYYPKEKVLTLWDNGKNENTRGFFETSAVAHNGATYLEAFKNEFRGWFSSYSRPADVANPMIAYSYIRSCGKNCSTREYDWRQVDNFLFSNAITNNPQLAQAPVPPMMR